MELKTIPVQDIVLADDNVREKVGNVHELALSIANTGLLQPLLVSPVEGNGHFRVVAGNRRLTAIELVRTHPDKYPTTFDFDSVPCLVEERSEGQRTAAMLVENLQRVDLNPIEEARGYFRLVRDQGWSQTDIAARIGKSKAHVSKRLLLLTLPTEALKLIEKGDLSIEAALQLAKLAEAPELILALIDRFAYDLEEGENIPEWAITSALRDLSARQELDKVTAAVQNLAPEDIAVTTDATPFNELATEGTVMFWIEEKPGIGWDKTFPEGTAVVEVSRAQGATWLNFYGYAPVDDPDLVDVASVPSGDAAAGSVEATAKRAAEDAKRKVAERIDRQLEARRVDHERQWLAGVAAKPKAADLKVLLHSLVLHEITQYNAKDIALVLDVEPVVRTEKGYTDYSGNVGKDRTVRDYVEALRLFMAESAANADRVAYVLAFQRLENAWHSASQELRDRLKQEQGYVPFDPVKVKAELTAKANAGK